MTVHAISGVEHSNSSLAQPLRFDAQHGQVIEICLSRSGIDEGCEGNL